MTPAEKYYASIKASRDDWAALFDRCFICQSDKWRHFTDLQTHEIIPRSALPLAWATAYQENRGGHGLKRRAHVPMMIGAAGIVARSIRVQ